jgi:malonyl-CoA O-methyltransferase
MPTGPAAADTPTVDPALRIDARVETVARQFGRRATRLGVHDVLLREIGRRLLERLDLVRLAVDHVLDIGCGLGRMRADLLARYPQAQWTGVERSMALARAGVAEQRRGQGLARWWRTAPRWIVADGARLPLADGCADLLVSNLMLHWHPAPHQVFPEWKRVLRVDGLLMFSCFGPDTLKELRRAASQALPHAMPMPFVDMHDFGDMLVASGFAGPVMDVETLRLTYGSAHELLAEARALGANPRSDRWPALPSGRQARRLIAALDEQRDRDGRLALTFEVAYGHAWRPASRERGQQAISVAALRDELSRRRR